ncbi:hypothetical protein [Altererythrobacter lauratis]|uniref:Uncharacterized protein n=1 Tax=Alteraurantiacibacter lauratis TaxID=2054627 RepID=A0ABV7ECH1_9SPHN
MRRWHVAAAIGGAVLLAWQPAPALARPDPFVPAESRQLAAPRPVAVFLPQQRIASSIELGRIAFPAGGGGALGAIIINGNNDIPERLANSALERAEGWITPLVEALDGFDITPLASNATLAALEQTGWLGTVQLDVLNGEIPQATEGGSKGVLVSTTYGIGLFGPAANSNAAVRATGETITAMERDFAAAYPDAAERAQVLWRYQMSPDFTQVQVIADVTLVRKNAAEPFYKQQVIALVRLPRPSFVEEENVARWAANDGALARAALTSAFARVGQVLPQVLALDREGFAAATDRRRESATVAGFHGPVLRRDAGGPVIWARDGDQRFAAFVTAQNASE